MISPDKPGLWTVAADEALDVAVAAYGAALKRRALARATSFCEEDGVTANDVMLAAKGMQRSKHHSVGGGVILSAWLFGGVTGVAMMYVTGLVLGWF